MFFIKNTTWESKKTLHKGWGIFTKKQIKRGVIISDYLGKIIRTAEYDIKRDKEGLYLMFYSDQASIYPDLSLPGPHLLNHSCAPNCWIYIYRGHTLFFALRDILPKEELTISYLLDPNDGSCKSCSHICMCGSDICTGTMHLSKEKYNLWQNHLHKVANKTRRSKIVFGDDLLPLSSYPKCIPQDPIYKAMLNSN